MPTKHKPPTPPRCPHCHDDMIYARRERLRWSAWALRWECRRCGTSVLTADNK